MAKKGRVIRLRNKKTGRVIKLFKKKSLPKGRTLPRGKSRIARKKRRKV